MMNRPTREFCTAQLKLLRRLPGFVEERDAIEELVLVLMDVGFSNDHVSRMITHWLRNERFAPRVVDLYDLAESVELVEDDQKPARCERCAELNGIISYHNQRRVFERCDCPRARLVERISIHYLKLKKLRGSPTSMRSTRVHPD